MVLDHIRILVGRMTVVSALICGSQSGLSFFASRAEVPRRTSLLFSAVTLPVGSEKAHIDQRAHDQAAIGGVSPLAQHLVARGNV